MGPSFVVTAAAVVDVVQLLVHFKPTTTKFTAAASYFVIATTSPFHFNSSLNYHSTQQSTALPH